MSRSVITPECVLSYPHLFEPRETPSGELKYSASFIFNKDADLSGLRRAAKEAAVARWGDKAAAMIKSRQLRMPFRDGAEKADSRGYGPGKVFINASSERAPGVVDRYAGPDGKPRPIDDPEAIYPGCLVRASLAAFAYDQAGNRGVAFALNNVQKLGEGERLDGRLPAEDEFAALEDAPVDLELAAFDDEGDPDEPVTSHLKGIAGRAQQRRRRRLPRQLDDDDNDDAPWGDAAA